MPEEKTYTPEELEAIRAKCLETLKSAPKDLAASTDLVCADCLLCEAYNTMEGPTWLIAPLCKEIVEHILPVIHSDDNDYFMAGIHVCVRAAETLQGHPRLKHRLLKYALDTRISKSLQPDFDLERDVNFLAKNILNADMGHLDKVEFEGHLKHDPVEWTKEYEDVIHLAEEKAHAELADHPRGMGFCYAYWPTLRRILLTDYGITWRDPKQMNPRVMFD